MGMNPSFSRQVPWRGKGKGHVERETERDGAAEDVDIGSHTSHVTRHTSHVTRHTSHVTQLSSVITRACSCSSFLEGQRRAPAFCAHQGEMDLPRVRCDV